MYSTSTQKKYYTFSSKEELNTFRINANKKYISSCKKGINQYYYLTPDEELCIVRYHEGALREFFLRFMPRNQLLPKDVKGTTFHFYKRFFLFSSVMDFHPKEIMITCVYLACKICEYNLPIDLFVNHIEGDPKLLKNIILDQELELLHRLNFNLNIHTPYRAIEGLIIDLKARSHLQRPERLYEHIARFLSTVWFTDVCLLYSPALIALAAVMHAVTRCKENIDQFVMKTLLNDPPEHVLQGVIRSVREIRSTVMNLRSPPTNEEINELEKKLAKCRNPYNDPTSAVFKRRMMEYALESYGPEKSKRRIKENTLESCGPERQR